MLDDLPLFQPSAKIGLTPEIVKAVEVYLDEKTNKILRASPIVRLGQNPFAVQGGQELKGSVRPARTDPTARAGCSRE